MANSIRLRGSWGLAKGPSSVELIVIGNEILNGAVLDTNSHWLADRLYNLGLYVRRITKVRDDLKEISSAIKEAVKRRTEWIITSGGLGPTFDDKTLQGVAIATKRSLTLNKEAVEMLRERYEKLKEMGVVETAELTPPRLKMAKLPRGAKPLRNRAGSAPGVLLKYGKSWIVCLPGVPVELKDIFINEVEPLILQKSVIVKRRRVWITVRGVPESTLSPHIDEILARHRNVYIKSHPQGIEDGVSKVVLEILGEDPSEQRVNEFVESAAADMMEKLKNLGAKEIVRSEEKPI
jgi:nicotinamide-nucleotide amidase